MKAAFFALILIVHPLISHASDLGIFTSDDLYACHSGNSARLSPPTPGQDLPDDGSVWRVGTNRWNEASELAYATWVSENVKQDFMQILGIATDCTDAVIAIRTIFARIHHLPILFLDGNKKIAFTTKEFQKLATVRIWNENNWKTNLQKDKRFLAFLNLLKTQIGSVNFPESLYPKRILSSLKSHTLSEQILAGTVLQYPSHTAFLARVDYNSAYSPLIEYASSAGQEVRLLNEYTTPTLALAAPGRGVMGFRWPVHCKSQAFELARRDFRQDYSEEQYHLNTEGLPLGKFLESITPGKRSPIDLAYVSLKLKELSSLIKRRSDLVTGAQEILKKNPDAFVRRNSPSFEEFSTEGLDALINTKFRDLFNTVKFSGSASSFDLNNYYYDQMHLKRLIAIKPGVSINYWQFFHALANEEKRQNEAIHQTKVSPSIVSSLPADSIEARWGLPFLEKNPE